MYHYQPVEEVILSANGGGHNNGDWLSDVKSHRLVTIVAEIGELSSLTQEHVQDLTQPMTIIMGLGELLRLQIDQDSRLAADLAVIVEQIGRMNHTVKEISELAEYNKKMLNQLQRVQSVADKMEQVTFNK